MADERQCNCEHCSHCALSCKDSVFIMKHNIPCTLLGGRLEMPSCHYALCCSVVKYDIHWEMLWWLFNKAACCFPLPFFWFCMASVRVFYHWILNINVLVVISAVWCGRWVEFVSLLLTPRAPCGTMGLPPCTTHSPAGALQCPAPSLTGSLESEAMFSKLWINLWLQYQVVFLGKISLAGQKMG